MVWGTDFLKNICHCFSLYLNAFFFFFPKYQQTNSPNKPPLHWPGSYEGCKCINVNVVSPTPRSFISDQSLAPALLLPIGPCKPLLSAWCPLNLSGKLSKKKKNAPHIHICICIRLGHIISLFRIMYLYLVTWLLCIMSTLCSDIVPH